MNLVFAAAEPGRLGEIDRLIRTAFTPYLRALGREIAPDAYGWFAEAIVQGDIFAAFDGQEIVGAIATRRPAAGEWELALIGVSPTRQKSGIASWMIGQMESIARARGMHALTLVTAEMMEDRVRLYSRHGFRIARRGPQAEGKDRHVRVYMRKELHDIGT